MTLAVRFGQRTAIYGELRLLTDGCRRASQAAGITLLAVQPLIDYGNVGRYLDVPHYWGCSLPRPDNGIARMVNQVLRCTPEATKGFNDMWPVSRITGEHHTLVTPAEALLKLQYRGFVNCCRVVTLITKIAGTQAWAAGVLLWFACADVSVCDLVMGCDRLWLPGSLEKWGSAAKDFSADLKMHQHYTDAPLQHLFEFQVLLNRGIGAVDWGEEKQHRLEPDVVPISYGEVFSRARDLFAGATRDGFVYAEETWENFWSRRWASTPTGSMHSQYDSDQRYIIRERQFRTKFFSVLQMPEIKITALTCRKPEIVAWPSIKSEWGKERAIYGTDFTSYELTDFAMPAAEEALSHMFPIGRKANERYVSKRVGLAGAEGIPVCFDFADFNSQHSLSSMLAVVMAYYDVHGPSMSPDQDAAMQWVIRSVGVQRIEGDDPYVSKGTLLSGWRLTTLVNTVLNHVYLDWAGSLTGVLDSVHNGDDVLMYCPDVQSAVVALRNAREHGIRAQPAKCVIAGIGEFLRVDREAKEPTGAQYLTRAVATAVHARAESGLPENVRDALSAQLTRITELGQRGAPETVLRALRKDAYRNNARVFSMSISDVSLLADTHFIHGGVSTDASAPAVWRFEEDRESMYEDSGKVRHSNLPGVRAYAKSICASFMLGPTQIPSVIMRVARATQKATTLSRTAVVKVKISDPAAEKIALGIYKSASKEYAVANLVGKARMAGLPVGRLAIGVLHSDTIARITTAENPIRMMQIIF